MRSKVFDTLITYLQPTRIKDSFGQVQETFAEYQKAMVTFDAYSGDEPALADRWQETEDITVLGHFVSGVDNTFRIGYEGNQYNILSIEPLERKRWMRVKAAKVNE